MEPKYTDLLKISSRIEIFEEYLNTASLIIQGDPKRWTQFVCLYFLNYILYVNDLHNT